MHAEGAAVAAQLGHAGLVANTRSNRTQTLAPSTRLSPPAMGLVRRAPRRRSSTRSSPTSTARARVAVEAGFDAVEVHLGHNYLLSSFLSPNLNKRTRRVRRQPREPRAAFPRRVVEAVRARRRRLGGRHRRSSTWPTACPSGLWLDESLRSRGCSRPTATSTPSQLTGGSSLLNGMYFFRGEVPMAEFVAAQPQLVGLGLRVFGRRIFPTYPFEEAFFLPLARQFRAALSMPLILLGGINRLDTIEDALGEGFEFVAMARALLREPDLVNRLARPAAPEGLCVHCNKCMPTIYTGTRCVIRETLR